MRHFLIYSVRLSGHWYRIKSLWSCLRLWVLIRFDHFLSVNVKPDLELIMSWHWSIEFKTWFKNCKNIFQVAKVGLHELTLPSPQKAYLGFSRFAWVYLRFLGVVYLFFLGLIAKLLTSFLWYLQVEYLRTWKKKFKLNVSSVSEFSFWAIEPIRKDRNDGKFGKPHFTGK